MPHICTGGSACAAAPCVAPLVVILPQPATTPTSCMPQRCQGGTDGLFQERRAGIGPSGEVGVRVLAVAAGALRCKPRPNRAFGPRLGPFGHCTRWNLETDAARE
eukprot:scaffold7296_cov100-Isochrysis_galbana.AAC.2